MKAGFRASASRAIMGPAGTSPARVRAGMGKRRRLRPHRGRRWSTSQREALTFMLSVLGIDQYQWGCLGWQAVCASVACYHGHRQRGLSHQQAMERVLGYPIHL